MRAFHLQELAMLPELEREVLESEFSALVLKLQEQGIQTLTLTDDQVKNLDLKSLRDLVRRYEKLARTPGGR
jgi:hypothetical protein